MAYTKAHKLHLKQAISILAKQQKDLKNQRKTVHLSGTRTQPAWKAVSQHQINRYDLRHLYIAYGIMRGKTIDQVEPNRKTQYSQSKIDKILSAYEQAVCTG